MTQTIVIVGSGGREHALARALAASPGRPRLLAVPGNPGTAAVARNVALPLADHEAMATLCAREGVSLAVIGPEDPLIAGLGDRLRAAGVAVFGPGADGARLEGDKEFAKEVMAAAGLPTAPYAVFTDRAAAAAYLETSGFPIVIKAVGPAQGKGVAVCPDRAAALAHLDACLVERRFGAAGSRVLIEACLTGLELSVLAVTDGRDFALLAPARDHKRALDGDRGPNTGGMGAFAPVPLSEPGLSGAIARRIVAPLLAELRRRGIDYRGVVYAGLMLTASGPQVLEFNCRFGDPETQAVLPLLRGDPVALLSAAAEGRLAAILASLPPPGPGAPADWPGAGLTDWAASCVVVVGASRGYPGSYGKGAPVRLPDASEPGAWIVHAGTAAGEGGLVTAGGRVLNAVGVGASLAEARRRAYDLMARIGGAELHYRRDIAAPAVAAADREVP